MHDNLQEVSSGTSRKFTLDEHGSVLPGVAALHKVARLAAQTLPEPIDNSSVEIKAWCKAWGKVNLQRLTSGCTSTFGRPTTERDHD